MTTPRPPFAADRRVRAGVEIALVALLATGLAWGGWRLTTPAAPTPSLAPQRAGGTADVGVFGRFDAFFRRGAPTEAAQDLASAGWRLTATRTGADASAIIQKPDGAQAAYRPGEAVGEGLILRSVARDHAVLEQGGRAHRLEFTDGPPPPPPGPSAPAPTAAIGAEAAQAAAAMGVAPPQQDVYVAALRPQMRDGRVEGYVWRRGADGGQLAAMGLREGDVILSVDGEPTTSDERLWELGSTLNSGRSVVIAYRRGQQVLTATYTPNTD